MCGSGVTSEAMYEYEVLCLSTPKIVSDLNASGLHTATAHDLCWDRAFAAEGLTCAEIRMRLAQICSHQP